jgi:Na+-translocating ferredoxin:NAD+ oxidoreductase RnfE subunit
MSPRENISSLNRAMSWLLMGCVRELLAQALMGAGLIILLAVVSQDLFQVTFIDDQQVIQAFFPDAAHPPLRIGVGIGSPIGGSVWL